MVKQNRCLVRVYVIFHNRTKKTERRKGEKEVGLVVICRVKSPMPWQHRTAGAQTYIDLTNAREEGRSSSRTKKKYLLFFSSSCCSVCVVWRWSSNETAGRKEEE